MNLDIDDLVRSLKYDTDFDEVPVPLEVFATSEDYLGLPPLSDYQIKMIEAATQIYREETLIALYGEKEGKNRFKQTFNELIYLLGKGAGKDHSSTIACAYVVYLLLCLKDPSAYYGKPSGDAIDIINIAINAQQARTVFFKGFCSKIERSPWFRGKYDKKADVVEFDKHVTVYSGHSEREAWEGLNLIMAVLDEISGFSIENTSGNTNAKTADEIYRMFSASVTSRFSEFGKVLLLSFPRYKGDFLYNRYYSVIAEKDTINRTHIFKLDEELPDGIDSNEFTIEWDEDRISKYNIPRVFALKRPTWEINPTVPINSLKNAFISNTKDSLSRFACCAEGQKVWTNKGLIPIEDVRKYDLVSTRNGSTRVVEKWGQEKECIKITTKSGLELICSLDHGISKVTRVRIGNDTQGKPFAERLGKYKTEWVEAGELNVGDEILAHYDSSELYGSNAVTVDEAYIMGLVLADGWIGNYKVKRGGIACGIHKDFAEEVCELIKNTLGPAHVVAREPDPKLSTKTQYNVGFSRKVIDKLWSLGMNASKSNQKTVPDSILSSSRDSIISFISGFIDGDGSVSKAGTISFCSTSKELLSTIQLLLSGLGIRASIHVNKRVDIKANTTINSNYTLYGMNLRKFDSLILRPMLSLRSYKKESVMAEPYKDGSGKGINQKLNEQIASIENVGIKNVYDITTGNHEFVCQSVVVHNCMPPDAIDSYFGSRDKIEHAFRYERIMVDEQGNFDSGFKPDPEATYYMHVDLAQVHDRCAVAMSHVTGWQEIKATDSQYFTNPKIEVDFVRYWTPTKDNTIDLSEVKQFILQVVSMGFNVGIVTFDRWGSVDMIKELNNMGIRAENLSLAKKHYDDMKLAIFEERITGPKLPILIDELVKLRVTKNNKVDHPQGGHNDLSEAVCGSIYNTTAYSSRYGDESVEVVTLSDLRVKETNKNRSSRPGETVVPPKMPEDIKEFIMNLKII